MVLVMPVQAGLECPLLDHNDQPTPQAANEHCDRSDSFLTMLPNLGGLIFGREE